ncbi:uncharacterized protein LOC143289766 isoform X2 [Babylonia areolata]|uniref:uncharacterized protein LOC143289766 isoform X2 n=1 Tax=Babylonia areolata TaxID=304850 RepID=UPI003FD0A8D4
MATMQRAGGAEKATTPSEDFLPGEDTECTIPKVFREGDHSTDIVFTVQGQRIHFSKALLTMCSPVFRALLTPEYLRQNVEGIPLPGMKYSEVAFFLQLLHPVYSSTPLTDCTLVETLTLAKEFHVEHISARCEQYIDAQLKQHGSKKKMNKDRILIYLTACDRNQLTKHRDKLVGLAAQYTTKDLQTSLFFESLSSAAQKDVFLRRCQTLENKMLPRRWKHVTVKALRSPRSLASLLVSSRCLSTRLRSLSIVHPVHPGPSSLSTARSARVLLH